jgi:hypothetical protein
MDLDYFLQRERISLEKARTTNSVEARYSHALLARAYGRRVLDLTEAAAAMASAKPSSVATPPTSAPNQSERAGGGARR